MQGRLWISVSGRECGKEGGRWGKRSKEGEEKGGGEGNEEQAEEEGEGGRYMADRSHKCWETLRNTGVLRSGAYQRLPTVGGGFTFTKTVLKSVSSMRAWAT